MSGGNPSLSRDTQPFETCLCSRCLVKSLNPEFVTNLLSHLVIEPKNLSSSPPNRSQTADHDTARTETVDHRREMFGPLVIPGLKSAAT